MQSLDLAQITENARGQKVSHSIHSCCIWLSFIFHLRGLYGLSAIYYINWSMLDFFRIQVNLNFHLFDI